MESRAIKNKYNKLMGDLVREHRLKMGLSQAQLAEQLGYDTLQFVSNVERGTAKLPLSTLGKLIELLGISQKRIIDIQMNAFNELLLSEIETGKRQLKKV